MAASLPWKAEFASIHCLRLDRFLYSLTRGLRAISCLACTVCPVPLAIFLWLVHRHRFAFPVLFLQHNCRKFPWYLAISNGAHNREWTPWTAWPWAVLIAGVLVFWIKAKHQNASLRLFSLEPLDPESP